MEDSDGYFVYLRDLDRGMLWSAGHQPTCKPAEVYDASYQPGALRILGRGGWTWYTGSAGWMYRVALESVLGLRVENGNMLRVRPCIPDDWPGFSVRWRLADSQTHYEIAVRNAHGRAECVQRVIIDEQPGVVQDGAAHVPLTKDAALHHVHITLGAAERRA